MKAADAPKQHLLEWEEAGVVGGVRIRNGHAGLGRIGHAGHGRPNGHGRHNGHRRHGGLITGHERHGGLITQEAPTNADSM